MFEGVFCNTGKSKHLFINNKILLCTQNYFFVFKPDIKLDIVLFITITET
jgi:hypothetical protein